MGLSANLLSLGSRRSARPSGSQILTRVARGLRGTKPFSSHPVFSRTERQRARNSHTGECGGGAAGVPRQTRRHGLQRRRLPGRRVRPMKSQRCRVLGATTNRTVPRPRRHYKPGSCAEASAGPSVPFRPSVGAVCQQTAVLCLILNLRSLISDPLFPIFDLRYLDLRYLDLRYLDLRSLISDPCLPIP